jgi:hypothetical protein
MAAKTISLRIPRMVKKSNPDENNPIPMKTKGMGGRTQEQG